MNEKCKCGPNAYYWSAHQVALIDNDTGRPYHAIKSSACRYKNGNRVRPCGGFFEFSEAALCDLEKWGPLMSDEYFDWLPE